jgi:fatty-acyl-CoA synthase
MRGHEGGTRVSWNFGDLLDAVAEAVPPDAPALLHGDRAIAWADFDRRSNRLARALLARGLQPGDKVALYLRNVPEYVEVVAACFKARLVHVNVNYRYLEEELRYLFDNSDAAAVVFSEDFAEPIGRLRAGLPRLRARVQVGSGDGLAPGVEHYDALVAAGDGGRLALQRSPDDLLFLYTGGTTGMPKGVMWRHEDLFEALGRGASALNGNRRPADLAAHREGVRAAGGGVRQLPACPLMHGTGLFTAIGAIVGGGSVVTLPSHRFDPHELWQAVARQRVQSIAIVGDAFARPMLRALDEKPGEYDLSSLAMIVSSGVMWSPEVKQGLLRHHPKLLLVDSFGSSEAVGFGSSVTTARGAAKPARFQIGERVKVFTEDGREVVPGSGEPGFVARAGPIPLGYYKDPEKTAKTFRTVGGVRYSIPGDWCTVDVDGTIQLLGRGSVCINTAGEKVYPEEVEEALKTHPAVYDALVVGVPDEKWGQAVTGVVELHAGAAFDEEELRAHVRARLAGYKCPKRVLRVDSLGRAANGKADYKRIAEHARAALGL